MMDWHKNFEYKDGEIYWKMRDSSTKEGKRFNARHAGKRAGSLHMAKSSQAKYRRVVLNSRWIMVHKVVWEMHYGVIPEGKEIDHIDGDGENNKIENLRLVSALDNMKNRPIYSNNKSGVAGVNWDSKSKKWKGRVAITGGMRITVYLGDSIDDAEKAILKSRKDNGYHANHGRCTNAK